MTTKFLPFLAALNAFFVGMQVGADQLTWVSFMSITAVIFCLVAVWIDGGNK